MQEFPKSDRPSKGGRRPFVPTRRQRDKVTLLIAAGFPEPAIAIAIGCCQNTLRRYFATELQTAACFGGWKICCAWSGKPPRGALAR
jgi:hypothetical protein